MGARLRSIESREIHPAPWNECSNQFSRMNVKRIRFYSDPLDPIERAALGPFLPQVSNGGVNHSLSS
jgi:hypothetical protein